MQVFKFGGASVKDASSVKNVVSILKGFKGAKLIVVISAMGKVTNKLEELVNAWFFKEGDTDRILTEIKEFHLQLCNQLFTNSNAAIYNDVENVFVELLWAIEEEPSFPYNHHYDQIVSQGEILSTRIVSAYLNQE